MGLATVTFFTSCCLTGAGIVLGRLGVAEEGPCWESDMVTVAAFLRGMLNSLVPLVSVSDGRVTLSLEDGEGVASLDTGAAMGSEDAVGMVVAVAGGTETSVGVVTIGGGDVTVVDGGSGMVAGLEGLE